MNPPRHTEPQANGALAQALMKRHPLWDETTIHTEQTRVLRGSSGRRVDILIHTPGRQPVAVETEFAPAATVENDAMGGLDGSWNPPETRSRARFLSSCRRN